MLWDMEKQYFNSGVILKLYQTAAANWCEILSLHDAAVTSPAHFETMGATFGTEISRQLLLPRAQSLTCVQHLLTVQCGSCNCSLVKDCDFNISLPQIIHPVITFHHTFLFFTLQGRTSYIYFMDFYPSQSHLFTEFIIYQHKTLKKKNPFQA